MGESFLKALLHDILGVFSRAGDASRNEEDPFLVTFDENLERLSISALRCSDEEHVYLAGMAVDRSNSGPLFADIVYEFG